MNKRNLMDFIESSKYKAIHTADDEYSVKIKEEKLDVLRRFGYLDRIIVVQGKINSLFSESQDLILDMKECPDVRYDHYHNIANKLSGFIGESTILEDVFYHGDFDGGSVELLRNELSKLKEEISANYNKVRIVCQAMTSAKKIAEYLKGIGFDLSELEEKPVYLVPELDASKLFYKGGE